MSKGVVRKNDDLKNDGPKKPEKWWMKLKREGRLYVVGKKQSSRNQSYDLKRDHLKRVCRDATYQRPLSFAEEYGQLYDPKEERDQLKYAEHLDTAPLTAQELKEFQKALLNPDSFFRSVFAAKQKWSNVFDEAIKNTGQENNVLGQELLTEMLALSLGGRNFVFSTLHKAKGVCCFCQTRHVLSINMALEDGTMRNFAGKDCAAVAKAIVEAAHYLSDLKMVAEWNLLSQEHYDELDKRLTAVQSAQQDKTY